MNQDLLRLLIEAELAASRAYQFALTVNRHDVADEVNEARQHITDATSLVVAGKGQP